MMKPIFVHIFCKPANKENAHLSEELRDIINVDEEEGEYRKCRIDSVMIGMYYGDGTGGSYVEMKNGAPPFKVKETVEQLDEMLSVCFPQFYYLRDKLNLEI